MEIRRYTNMAISRKSYIDECESTSLVWIEHAVKLLAFDYPQCEKLWKDSVAKGFKADTRQLVGHWDKPIDKRLSVITDANDKIDSQTFTDTIEFVLEDPDYNGIHIKPSFNINKAKEAILELHKSFKSDKIYTKHEVKDIINNWYNKYK